MQTLITEINFDLDGVLVDFDEFAIRCIGIDIKQCDGNRELKKEFWARVKLHIQKHGTFFDEMQWLHDGPTLWNAVVMMIIDQGLRPEDLIRICTATGKTDGGEHQKRKWVADNLGQIYAASGRYVVAARDKAQYAHSTALLIDDREKAVIPWREAGGIAILHRSAEQTIAELQALNIKLEVR